MFATAFMNIMDIIQQQLWSFGDGVGNDRFRFDYSRLI